MSVLYRAADSHRCSADPHPPRLMVGTAWTRAESRIRRTQRYL